MRSWDKHLGPFIFAPPTSFFFFFLSSRRVVVYLPRDGRTSSTKVVQLLIYSQAYQPRILYISLRGARFHSRNRSDREKRTFRCVYWYLESFFWVDTRRKESFPVHLVEGRSIYIGGARRWFFFLHYGDDWVGDKNRIYNWPCSCCDFWQMLLCVIFWCDVC